MDKQAYEKLRLLLFLLDERDVVCTSLAPEEDWEDDDADVDGWT